jgi:trans-aconitate methyltransferase
MQTAKHQWDAEDYAKNSSAQLAWAQELIAKLDLCGSEAVLDMGCGDGKISAQLARAVGSGRVLGIDLSDSMIRFASRQHPRTENPNLSFRQMDATNIRLPERFDIVFSNATLHWVHDHVAVLRGVHGALNRGGRILFQMGGHGAVAEVLNAIEEVMRHPRWLHYFADFTSPYHFYGPEEYGKWLSECGFRPQRVELIEKDMQHRGVEGLTGWLRTTWFPYTDCLPGDLREAFLAEVVAAYTSTFPIDASGNSHVRMVRLEVAAVAL